MLTDSRNMAKNWAYRQLESSDLPFEGGVEEKTTSVQTWIKPSNFILSIMLNILLGALLTLTYLLPRTAQCPAAFYPTELRDATSRIKHETITFDSALWLNESTNAMEMIHDPAKPQYVGQPSPEIDRAWSDLLNGAWLRFLLSVTNSQLSGEYVVMNEDEIASFPGLTPLQGHQESYMEWVKRPFWKRVYLTVH